MNGLRRLLLAAYSLLFAAVCAALIALAWNQDQQFDINPGDFRFVSYISSGASEKYAFTALMAALVLFGFLSFLVAISRGSDRRPGTLRVRQADGSVAEVSTDSVETLLRDEIESIAEVRQATPQVRANGNSIDVDVAATVEPNASIARVTSLVGQTTLDALRERLGATNVRRPRVAVRYDELNARPMGRPKPQAPPTMPPQQPMASEPWPAPPAGVYERPAAPARPAGEPWPSPPEGMRLQERPGAPPVAPEAVLPGAVQLPAEPDPWVRGPRWEEPPGDRPGEEATERRE